MNTIKNINMGKAFVVTFLIFLSSLGQNSFAGFSIIPARASFEQGQIFEAYLLSKNIRVQKEEIEILYQGRKIVVPIQTYFRINEADEAPRNTGILMGHGWTSNMACWVHYVELALNNNLRPVTLVWPGHGLANEPSASGGYRGHIENSQFGDYEPDYWMPAVGPALDQLMRSRFEKYIYMGHSMGDMIASRLNSYGHLSPDLLVLVGGPANFNDLDAKARRLMADLSDLIFFTGWTMPTYPYLGVPGVASVFNRFQLPNFRNGEMDIEYQIYKSLLAPTKDRMLAKVSENPLILSAGPFHQDYLHWFARQMSMTSHPTYELNSPVIFMYGANEQIPRSGLADTYPARARNQKWVGVEVPGVDHLGEMSKEASAAIFPFIIRAINHVNGALEHDFSNSIVNLADVNSTGCNPSDFESIDQ